MLDCSLRLLHDRKRQTLPWYRSAPTPLIQKALGYKPLIKFFFGQLARPKAVKNILRQAYGRKEAVTDELVTLLLEPAFDEGAVEVFLAFYPLLARPYCRRPFATARLPGAHSMGQRRPLGAD